MKYHHERYDGHGYPEGLKGENIPMVAAIIAVADTFDAMTTDRPYRKGLNKDKAIAEIKECVNKQFNPTNLQDTDYLITFILHVNIIEKFNSNL